MDKSKIWFLVALMLALFFLGSMEVNAANAVDERPSHHTDVLHNGTVDAVSKNYRFTVGADDITINNSSVYFSYASGNAVFSFDTGDLYSDSAYLNSWNSYDFFQFYSIPYFTASLTYADNGFDSFTYFVDIMPYVKLNGEKYYLVNNIGNKFTFNSPSSLVTLSYGADIDVSISYDGQNASSEVIKSFFGYAKLNVAFSTSSAGYSIYGNKYISTGENAIVGELDELEDTVSSQGSSIVSSLQSLSDRIYDKLGSIWSAELAKLNDMQTAISTVITTLRDNIMKKMDEQYNSRTTQLSNWQTALSNQLSTWKTSLATQMTNWQTALGLKLDEVIDTLTQRYDSSSANDTNNALSGSLDSWEAAEGAIMTDTKVEVSAYDTSSAFDFAPALVSSLTLITTFANGFFVASGDFSTALIVMIALVFVSVVVGLIRFVRS